MQDGSGDDLNVVPTQESVLKLRSLPVQRSPGESFNGRVWAGFFVTPQSQLVSEF